MGRSQRGDAKAFRILYDRHSPAVHAVATRVLEDRRDAEEATQDTFVSAWRHLGRFRGDSALSTWLHRICLNRCTSILRRRRPPEVALDRVEGRPDRRPGPSEVVALRHEVGEVGSALARVPEAARIALVLREVAQLSYGEVADVLGITLTAARSRIHRGRTALLDELGRRADDPPDQEARRGA